MPHNRPDYPSLNSKPACIKVVDTFRNVDHPPRLRHPNADGYPMQKPVLLYLYDSKGDSVANADNEEGKRYPTYG